MPATVSNWLPLETAPRDRPVDLRLERWVDAGERLATSIARGASWIDRTSVRHPAPHWSRVPAGWRVTGWQPCSDPEARRLADNRRGGPSVAMRAGADLSRKGLRSVDIPS
ncbi:hypothetical protein LKMONMHP_4421 [Methylobacterium organophilum]|uniref:Uncharacterized protein n=2 Tax=Methylobacterium organophilum TaxID=410 RepID=A0ABQ4TFN1_METOR|nr:hypothetical protein LKMONMHP_4421 [Methylobacterium organophilum]